MVRMETQARRMGRMETQVRRMVRMETPANLIVGATAGESELLHVNVALA